MGLFDVAFAMKWVQPRETLLLLALTGKEGGWVCFVSEVEKGL
jgi:hypothetical protein